MAKCNFKDTNRVHFTPVEWQRLLQCVKTEEKSIFCRGTSPQATRHKNNAWTRVSLAFNRGNVHKRSTKILKAKFENMKRLARDNNNQVSEDRTRSNSIVEPDNIKEEDNLEEEYCSLYSEPDNTTSDVPAQMEADQSRSNSPVTVADPLAGVASGYSEGGAKRVNSALRSVTQEDIALLKAEILQCELETAKLKQSQVRQAAASEQTNRALRARLLALQLREARLSAWTAEQKASRAGASADVLQYQQGEHAALETGKRFHS